jgi:hypothetical protein
LRMRTRSFPVRVSSCDVTSGQDRFLSGSHNPVFPVLLSYTDI